MIITPDKTHSAPLLTRTFSGYKCPPPPAMLAGMIFSDLAPFYADFGQWVTHTPQAGSPSTGLVLFDQPGTVIVGGEMLATDYAIRYPRVIFQSVKRGDQFSIGGLTYTARESAQAASIQGDEMIVPLSKN